MNSNLRLVLFMLTIKMTFGVVVHVVLFNVDVDVYYLCPKHLHDDCGMRGNRSGEYEIIANGSSTWTIVSDENDIPDVLVQENYGNGVVYKSKVNYLIGTDEIELPGKKCNYSNKSCIYGERNVLVVWNVQCMVNKSVDIHRDMPLASQEYVTFHLFTVTFQLLLLHEVSVCNISMWLTDRHETLVYDGPSMANDHCSRCQCSKEGTSILSVETNKNYKNIKNYHEKHDPQLNEIKNLLVIFMALVILWMLLKLILNILRNLTVLKRNCGLSKKEVFIKWFSKNLTDHSDFFKKTIKGKCLDEKNYLYSQHVYDYVECGISHT